MKRVLAVLSVAALLVLPARVFAHEGHVHKVMGTVTAVDAMHVEVDTKEGAKESYTLTGDTKYLSGKAPAKAADVKVGTRVVLSVVEKDGKKTATEVQMGEAKPADHDMGNMKMEGHQHQH